MPEGVHIEIGSSGARQVAQGFNRIDRSMGRMGRTSTRTSTAMNRQMRSLSAGARSLYGVLGGAGVAAGGKAVLDFNDALGQLQADMGVNTQYAREMGDEVLALARKHRLAKEDVMGALTVFQEFGGIVKEGQSILPGLAKVAKATGTPVAELATIASTLIATLGMSPTKALAAITQFNAQAIQGQIGMRDLAKIIPQIMGTGVGKGFKGSRAVGQLGTLLQVAGQLTPGHPEEARTKALALMRDLKKAAKTLEDEFDIRVLDKDKNLRDIDELMKAILIKTGGTLMTKKDKDLFTDESAGVAGIYKSMFDLTSGEFKKGSAQARVAGAKGGMVAIEKQYRLRTEGIAKEAEAVKGALKTLEEGLHKHGSKLISWIAENPYTAGGAAAGGVMAYKFGPSIIKGLFAAAVKRGRGGAGGGVASGLMGLPGGGVQPVYVVNLPGANLGQAIGFTGGGKMAKQTAVATTRLQKFGNVVSKAGQGVAVFGAAFAVGTALDQAFGISDKMSDHMVQAERLQGKLRAFEHGKDVKRKGLMEQARMYAGLAGKGVQSVGLPGGGKLDLTQAAVMSRLMGKAGELGISSKDQAALKPALEAILVELKKNRIVVNDKSGLDSVDVQVGRGPSN